MMAAARSGGSRAGSTKTGQGTKGAKANGSGSKASRKPPPADKKARTVTRPRALPTSSDDTVEYKGGKIWIRGDVVKVAIPAVHTKSGKEAKVDYKLRKGDATQITQCCNYIDERVK